MVATILLIVSCLPLAFLIVRAIVGAKAPVTATAGASSAKATASPAAVKLEASGSATKGSAAAKGAAPSIDAAQKPTIKPKSSDRPHSQHDIVDWDVTLVTASPLLADAGKSVPKLTDLGALPRLLEEIDQEVAEPSRISVIFQDEAEIDEKTSPNARILVYAQGDSDRGQKRQRNEDCLLAMPEHSLYAVADGMGGYSGGQVASTLAVETLRQVFESGKFEAEIQSDKPIHKLGHDLACAIFKANQAVYEAAQSEPTLSRMGTTTVAARFSPNKQRVYIGHVGDSRCYRIRGNSMQQLTTDHTLGMLGVKGAGSNDLLRAIGISPEVQIDVIIDKPQGDDVYMLCSDGLFKMLTDEQIRDLIVGESDLEAAVYGLIEAANDSGGKDNVTVVLVKVIEHAAGRARA